MSTPGKPDIAHLESIHGLPPSPTPGAPRRGHSGEAGPGASTGRLGRSPRCQPTGPCCSLRALKARVPHTPDPASTPALCSWNQSELVLWLRVVQKEREGDSEFRPHEGYAGGLRTPAPFDGRTKSE